MSQQQFFVSKGQTIRGPQTNTQRIVRNGRVGFTTTPGKVYGSHDNEGRPIPLPKDLVDFATNKIESNGQSCLQNWIESGAVVLEAGGQSPVQFAKAMPVEVEVDAKTGAKSESKKTK